VVRINCAHGGIDDWAAMIENTHSAGEVVGRRLRMLMDIAGAKKTARLRALHSW